MALKRLGPYQIIDVIGRGGMGTVFKAEDVESGEVVAVKSLAPSFSMDEHFRARFESEINALIQLGHENIVRLISFGQEDGTMFFAMELVEGESLHQELKAKKNLDWREVIQIGLDVCAGLKHAHDRGIIHRDLKPGNLLRATDGTVKITDFGIAKSFGNNELTGEGNVLGTMDFMAPEQAAGKAVTVRSDLYSLGTVMYALLAGKPPFHAKTLADLATKFTTHKLQRISKVNPNVPRELDRLIEALLQKNPKKRIATAHALRLQLLDIQEHLQRDAASQTAVVSKSPRTSDTVENQVPSNASTGPTRMEQRDATSLGPDADNEELRLADATHSGTIADTLAGSQTDYFEQVTPQKSKKKVVVATQEKSNLSTWLLAGALAVVIAIGSFGVYWAVIRKPSADSLIEKIESAEGRYPRVLTEIEKFIEYYPEHERIEEFRELERIANAMKYRNLMVKRANGPQADSLSQIEKQFLEAIDAAGGNLPLGYAQMAQLIEKGYDEPGQLNKGDARCLKACEDFLLKFRRDASEQKSAYSPTVDEAFSEAALVQQTDRRRCQAICKAIVTLYEDSEWAGVVVTRAKTLLKNLNG